MNETCKFCGKHSLLYRWKNRHGVVFVCCMWCGVLLGLELIEAVET